jgi:hypothetical protein
VTIELLDLSGRLVERQVCASPAAGGARVVLGANRPLPCAMYLVRATQGTRVATRRAFVIR